MNSAQAEPPVKKPPAIPNDLYVEMVHALFADGRSLLVGSLATSIAGLIAFLFTQNVVLAICALIIPAAAWLRLYDLRRYARADAGRTLKLATAWEKRYIFGAAGYMSLLSTWTMLVFALSEDSFVRMLALTATLGHALGIATRNFSIERLTNAQIAAAIIPLCCTFAWAGGRFLLMIPVVIAPIFFFIKVSAARLRETLLSEIIANRASLALTHQLDSALNNMSHGLAMFDRDGRIVVSNARLLDLCELPEGALRPGTTMTAILRTLTLAGKVTSDEANTLITGLVLPKEGHDPTICVQNNSGRTIEITIHHGPSGDVVVLAQDITDRRNSENAIRQIALFDAVTGLPNRSHLEQELQRGFGAGENLQTSILFLDLDNFKQVNDTLGHPVGDKLLCQVADRLKSISGDKDFMARWGGDEIVIVRRCVVKDDEVSAFAEMILQTVGNPFDIDGSEVIIGVSIGIAHSRGINLRTDTMLSHADTALYAAKSAGRSCWRVFEASMESAVRERRLLEMELRTAIANGSIEAFYQPIIDVRSRRVVGFEALARWYHATRGFVPPSEFIPLAEEIGLGNELGQSILMQACKACAAWPANVRIAVNISAAQFKGAAVGLHVTHALSASGLSASRLEIEITETAFLDDRPETHETLRALRELGVTISLDDFGTGYSSLSYLQKFPLNKVKLDRSFIIDITNNDKATMMVRSIAQLCTNLGMIVLVEGIETEAQLSIVKDIETISQAQGFLFSRAVPCGETLALIEGLEQDKRILRLVKGR